MSLNPSSCASAINSAMDNTIANWPTSAFASDFASAYKAYSVAGVVTGASSGTEDESILEDVLSSGDNYITEVEFGEALASYWGTVKLLPSGGAVSVSNNASSKVAEFTAAILASYTTTDSQPYYLNFITNIENVAKTIIWTVVYPNPLPPTSETIS